MTLVEVMVAFVVLMISLVPLSYLFVSSIIEAGQSNYQQTALSIAEHWAETLSNTTPPVLASTGAVIVDKSEPPTGPAPTITPPTVTSGDNNVALDTVSSIAVATGWNGTSSPDFATASASVPQVAYVVTGTSPNTVSNQITYTSMTATSLVCPSTCSTSPNVMATGDPVTQTEISTPTETRGGTTYGLSSEYAWATVQNNGVISPAISSTSVGQTLPQSTIYLASVANLQPASASSPQTLEVPTTSKGNQVVTYTGIQTSTPYAITGVTGGHGTIASGNAAQTPKPNLCTSGTPQLLKLTVTVSWGPHKGQNNVQDSVILNYPPSGVQTLGFIALQFTGDTNATDAQNNAWSERVQAVPVTIAGPQTITIYPDQNGCAFAQVPPGSYTVSVANATTGYPAGTTYGTPSFVANAAGSYTNDVWSPPTSEPVTSSPTIPVSIGAVTRVDTTYSANYPSYDQGATVNFSYPTSSAVEDGVNCPGSGQIACVTSGEGASSGGAEITWLNTASGNWSTAALPSLPGGNQLTRLTSFSCTTNACIGVGYGTTGSVILHTSTGTSPSLTADTPPTGVSSLTQISCLTSTTTDCVAAGTNSSGNAVVVTGTIGAAGSDSWALDSLPSTPTLTSVSSLQCSSVSNGCVALATTTTVGSPVIVSGPATSPSGTWAAGIFTGFTATAFTQVVCPTATSCMAIGTGTPTGLTSRPIVLNASVAGGTGIGSTGSTATWTVDPYTPTTVTVSSLSSIVCPITSSTPKCLVSGVGTSGTTTGAVFLFGAPGGPLGAEFPEVGTTPISGITQVTCPSSTQCQAIGLNASGPVIFTATINPTPATADTWTSDTVPTPSGTLSSLSQVACQSASNCLIMGTGMSAAGTPAGFLFQTSGGSGTSWTNVTLPTSDSGLQYFNGIACVATSGACSAVGATTTSAVIVSSSSGPGGTWSDGTPSTLSGNFPTGIPIEINNSSLTPSAYVNAVEAGASTAVTQLPLLFPFQGGYSMWAGDCQTELNAYDTAQAATIPGGTSGSTPGMPSPVIPLGVLPLAVTHKTSGLPDSAATVTLTAATSGCSADTYTLQSTGPDGLSRTEVPYGSFTLSIGGTSEGSWSLLATR